MNRKALVIGLGASGEACARFLLNRQYSVLATDTRDNPPALEKMRETEGFEFVGLDEAQRRLGEVAIVVISPGISPEHSAVTPLVERAKSMGLEPAGEIELFARELKRLKQERGYDPIVIGITGTNGKTTTTVLTTKMAQAAGKHAVAAGNIGPNAVTELDRYLQQDHLPEVWVLELSSFQLQTTTSLVPTAAAVLNITQDHIDWHGSFDNYIAAKKRIFAHPETVRVLNREDPIVMGFAEEGASMCTFGGDAPSRVHDWGLDHFDGIQWLVYNEDDSVALTKRKVLSGFVEQRLMPREALLIRGRHNAMNALAALALTVSAGLPLAPALKALSVYRGEPHRVQFVMTVDGVDYIDDSKGTNVGATVAALQGLGSEGKKLVVILGGDGKGQDFSPIAQAMQRYARAAVLIGRDAPYIEKALGACSYPVEHAKTLPEAVERCRRLAQKGDVVLLSPACASWDMFHDYAERSKIFIESARALNTQA